MTRTGNVIVATCVVAAAFGARRARAADPTTADCLRASESSLALRRQHRLLDARAELLICSSPSCPADVRAECVRRVADGNNAIPTIVFEAKDVDGNDLSVVKVTMDGKVLAEQLEGTPLSIDPGVHAFTFQTSGRPVVHKQFVIREGEKDRRERIAFAAIPTAIRTAPIAPVAAEPRTSISESSSSDWGTRKKVGLALGVAALGGLATGVTFGLIYDSRAGAFNDSGCGTSVPENGPPGCQARRDSVRSAEYVFVAGYASAAVLGGLGAYLFFTAPTEGASKADLASRAFSLRCLPVGGTGVSCGGRF